MFAAGKSIFHTHYDCTGYETVKCIALSNDRRVIKERKTENTTPNIVSLAKKMRKFDVSEMLSFLQFQLGTCKFLFFKKKNQHVFHDESWLILILKRLQSTNQKPQTMT